MAVISDIFRRICNLSADNVHVNHHATWMESLCALVDFVLFSVIVTFDVDVQSIVKMLWLLIQYPYCV